MVENKLYMKINVQGKDFMKYFRKGWGSFWTILSKNTWIWNVNLKKTDEHWIAKGFFLLKIKKDELSQ